MIALKANSNNHVNLFLCRPFQVIAGFIYDMFVTIEETKCIKGLLCETSFNNVSLN